MLPYVQEHWSLYIRMAIIEFRFFSPTDGDKADISASAYADINIIAGALKLYLRDLPIPVITFELYTKFIQAASKRLSKPSGLFHTVAALILIISSRMWRRNSKCWHQARGHPREFNPAAASPPRDPALPDGSPEEVSGEGHRGTVAGFVLQGAVLHQFYTSLVSCRVTLFEKYNLMNAENLGIVFGPTLMQPPEMNALTSLNDMRLQKLVVQLMIEHEDVLFWRLRRARFRNRGQ